MLNQMKSVETISQFANVSVMVRTQQWQDRRNEIWNGDSVKGCSLTAATLLRVWSFCQERLVGYYRFTFWIWIQLIDGNDTLSNNYENESALMVKRRFVLKSCF